MSTISVPDFDFSGFYYPEIYAAELAYMRVNAPELTSEEDEEPHIQLIRAFSLVGHLVNTYTDIAANELLNQSLTLRESMKALYNLINVKLASATPSICDTMLIRLSSIPTSDISSYIPAYSQFGTEPDDNGDQVLFETIENWPLDRCDQVSHVFAREVEHTASTGSVNTSQPTYFTDTSAAAFTAGDVGKKLFVGDSQYGNTGTYDIINFISSTQVELAGASFSTESGITWFLFDYSSDYATEANTSGSTFTPFSTLINGNMLYVGHNHAMWDQLDITTTVQIAGMTGVWQYFDNHNYKTNPSTISYLGGSYKIYVGPITSGWNAAAGSQVKVTYNPTGYTEVLLCDHSASVDTKGIFGQTTPGGTDEINILNYTISADWVALPDGNSGLDFDSADESLTWTLPMDEDRKWEKTTINEEEAYWVRWKIKSDLAPIIGSLPTIDEIDIDENNVYFPFSVTQGTTVVQEDLGSSNGQASQVFNTVSSPVFDDSQLLEVDETASGIWVEWSGQDNLLLSGASSRHYAVSQDSNDRQNYKFGDGVFGSIPPNNAELRVTYRIGGEENGNVGINTITESLSGLSFIGAIGNTQPALGWTIKEAGNDADLARMKIAGPASLRDNTKAANADDLERIATNEYTYNSSKIVARAVAVEEAYGPKTFQLMCVGSSGNFLTVDQLADIDEYFNGNKYSIPPITKKLISNHELTSINYTPHEIDVTVHVIGRGVTVSEIRNALSAYLNPIAQDDNGNYLHSFGGEVAEVMIDNAIIDISDDITDVQKTIPATNVTLGSTELPTVGTLIITVSES